MAILNFGSLNIDIFYDVDEMVEPGQTIKAHARTIRLGGKGFNQSVALCNAGGDVVHAGKIGTDGDIFIEELKKLGVKTEYILKTSESSSGHAIIQVDNTGENSIILYGGANKEITKAEADEILENFGENDYLLLQNEISNTDYILKRAKERKIKTALNLAPADKNLLRLPLNYADFLIMNNAEGALITGTWKPLEILKKLSQKYPETALVLTLASKGYMIYVKGKLISGKAYDVKAIDSTGAGDTFTGYFLANVVAGMTLEKSADIAAKAAALSVTVRGSSASVPTKEEVENANLNLKE